MIKLFLKNKREDSIKRFHPWVFSGAVQRIEGEPKEGEIIAVCSSNGEIIAHGHYQIGSIVVRILSFWGGILTKINFGKSASLQL